MTGYLRSFKGRLTLLVAVAVFVPLVATTLLLGARLSRQTRSLFASRLTASLETFTLLLQGTQDNLVKGLGRMAVDNTLALTLDLRIVPQLTRYMGRQREALGVSFLGVRAENDRSVVVVGATDDSTSIAGHLVFDPASDVESGECFAGRRPLQLMLCRGDVYLVATMPVEQDAATGGARGDASAPTPARPLGHVVGGIRLNDPTFLETLRRKGIEHPVMWVGDRLIVAGVADGSTRLSRPATIDGSAREYRLGATTYLAAVRSLPIDSSTLVYASLAPLDFLNRAFTEMALTVAGIGILLFVGTLGVLGLLVNRMARPIRQLQAGADRIGAGELDHRIEIRSGDEFQALAVSFNHMTAQLQESYSDLERKVADRTRDLTEALQRLTALAEVGRAVSSTLELHAVLDSIVVHAVRLTATDEGTIYEYDETHGQFLVSAACGMTDEHLAELRAVPVQLGEGAVGRAIASGQPVQIPDVQAPGAYPGRLHELATKSGVRALLAVPLVREGRIIGGLIVRRREPGRFSSELVDLLGTFAAQSALTIQNARLFRELREKSDQLEIASKHKSQFLANMSHELRTPMNAVLGYTDLILDNLFGEVPEEIRDTLERVKSSGQHLLGLINDVLDLSKIEAGQLTLSLNDYSMGQVVDAVVSAVESLATEKKLALNATSADDLPTGRGDERRITQVLLNLAGNAIKFTDAGEVSIQARASDGAFVVSVSDTGPGISEADQQRIFEEFQQADSSITKMKGGTGLGLSISRRIVELHGGRLWVESSVGRGSTFSFTVPIRVERQAEGA